MNKARIKEIIIRSFNRRIPPFVKIIRHQFGIRDALLSALEFGAVLAVLTATFHVLRAYGAVLIPGTALLIEIMLFWRLGGFDFLGKLLVSSAVLRETASQAEAAEKHVVASLHFLRDRQKAYECLYRLADNREKLSKLARLIRLNESKLSAAKALILARCCLQCGNSNAARVHYELADTMAPSSGVKLELAQAYMMSNMPEACLETLQGVGQSHLTDEYYFRKAEALRTMQRLEEALCAANEAIRLRPCNSEYHTEKGKILEGLGRKKAAVRAYSKALFVHPRNQDALFRRALLSLTDGQREAGIKDLERCYLYDNTRTEAYLLAERAKAARGDGVTPLDQREIQSWLHAEPDGHTLEMGATVRLALSIRPDIRLDRCHIVALEPFGSGLEVEPSEIVLGPVAPDQPSNVVLRVTAKRASQVNRGQPWALNLVLTADGFWANRVIKFHIVDSIEGRVLLVLTEDHEVNIHRERMGDAGNAAVKPGEVESDLVGKGRSANALADKYGFKWTHMLDAGTAVGLLSWAGERSGVWKRLSDDVESYYRSAYQRGHDFQLHLHLSAFPESYFFCYEYQPEAGRLCFNVDKKNSRFPGWQINSWANVAKSLGRISDVDTRLGSLARAREAVARVFTGGSPAYQPILFRAGQWDLGKNSAEREKSILALRENAILADSSVTDGYSYYEEGFGFGRPMHKATYFTSQNNPEKEAKSLADTGIVEIVPITLLQGRHPVTPRDDAGAVVRAYRSSVEGDRVKPGVHIIMEIEHLSTIPSGNGHQDWKVLERHLSTVRRECQDIEAAGAAEAIYAWLDYYSPDLIAKLEAPQTLRDEVSDETFGIRFPLTFLGQGILRDRPRNFELRIPLPIMDTDAVEAVRVLENGEPVFHSGWGRQNFLLVELALCRQNQRSFSLEILPRSSRPAFC